MLGSKEALVQYSMSLLPYLHRLMNKEALPVRDAQQAMSAVLRGDATTAQIAAFLTALRMKGETAEELQGLALAMRESAVKVEHGITGEPVLDTCGTGGDSQSTLNVSTLAAFVVTGAGVKVAKHGNRSISSRCGSADLLEALGARLLARPEDVARSIREVGFGFLFAPVFHPAMRHAQAARAELKTRTAFNLLGPLTNPAGATAQLAGAPSPQAAELIAVTLSSLGLHRGFVVHGAGGLDEVSTTGESIVLGIVRGAIVHRKVNPEDFGVPRVSIEQLRGGDVETNKQIGLSVFRGEKGPFRDIIVVNAAMALMAASKATDYLEAAHLAADALDSGAALKAMQAFVEFSHSVEIPA